MSPAAVATTQTQPKTPERLEPGILAPGLVLPESNIGDRIDLFLDKLVGDIAGTDLDPRKTLAENKWHGDEFIPYKMLFDETKDDEGSLVVNRDGRLVDSYIGSVVSVSSNGPDLKAKSEEALSLLYEGRDKEEVDSLLKFVMDKLIAGKSINGQQRERLITEKKSHFPSIIEKVGRLVTAGPNGETNSRRNLGAFAVAGGMGALAFVGNALKHR